MEFGRREPEIQVLPNTPFQGVEMNDAQTQQSDTSTRVKGRAPELPAQLFAQFFQNFASVHPKLTLGMNCRKSPSRGKLPCFLPSVRDVHTSSLCNASRERHVYISRRIRFSRVA